MPAARSNRAPGSLLTGASILAVLATAAAVSAVSFQDQEGAWVRVGMVLMTVGAGMALPRWALLPAAFAVWSVPSALRVMLFEAPDSFEAWQAADLAGLAVLAVATSVARYRLRRIDLSVPAAPVPSAAPWDEVSVLGGEPPEEETPGSPVWVPITSPAAARAPIAYAFAGALPSTALSALEPRLSDPALPAALSAVTSDLLQHIEETLALIDALRR